MEEAKSGKMIKFRTSDDQEVIALERLFKRSSYVSGFLDDNSDPDEIIHLPEITKATFEMVIKYFENSLVFITNDSERPA